MSGIWRDTARRLQSNRLALAAAGFIVAIALLSIVGPFVDTHRFDSLDWANIAVAPGAQGGHWLGTDRLGRDLFVRTLDGTRISLLIGLTAAAMSLAVGVAYGAIAGFAGGGIDRWMMRVVEILSGLPLIFFVILLTVLFGRGLLLLLASIGAIGWLTMARIVRGQTLSIRRREFIEAAVAGGAGPARIIFKHVVPNIIGPVIVYAMLTVPQMILFESFLSFLGLDSNKRPSRSAYYATMFLPVSEKVFYR